MSRRLRLRLAAFCFDHMHLDHLLEMAAQQHFSFVGVYDQDAVRMSAASALLGIPESDQFTNWEELVEKRRPDVAVICSTTRAHVEWCERLCAAGIHVVLEKPFALSAAEAERAIQAATEGGVRLAVNWPLAWYPSHRTTHRVIGAGTIGNVREIHYYGGNRGPQHHLRHGMEWQGSWWRRREEGGGSMLDYLGYGTTLATWFRGGQLPTAVSAKAHVSDGSEVDDQGIAIAEYPQGLSTFHSRWGTFTDPWVHQSQPACGFTVVGTDGTILSLDYSDTIRMQTEATPEGQQLPVESDLRPKNIFGELKRALTEDDEVRAPCDPITSLAGQRIVDAALESASTNRSVSLTGA